MSARARAERGLENKNVMPRAGIALLSCVFFAGAAHAQSEMAQRLTKEHVGDIEPGSYTAGHTSFTLDLYGDKYLIRFAGDPEVYVLYADHAPLGGRALKFDSGAIVIRVAGWGGMTLYTSDAPSGVPAERTGDTITPSLAPVTLFDMQNAADDESQHLAYSRRVHLNFTADWNALAGDVRLRALAFDAMENVSRGIDRFLTIPKGRDAFAKRIEQVRLGLGNKPVMFMSGKTLTITFNAQAGYAGRASSRGIARALGQILQVNVPD